MKNAARYWILAIAILGGITAFILFLFVIQAYITNRASSTQESPNFLPTPTSSPLLPQTLAAARVEALLKNNGGCRLPCWWGIIPGTTTWRQAHILLSPFMKLDLTLIGDNRNIETYFRGFYNFKDKLWVSLETPDQTVHTINIGMQEEYLSNLDITGIFQSYGRPDQIYIRAYNLSPDIPFQIFLYYPSQGIAAEYMYHVHTVDQTIQICNLDHPSSAEFYTGERALFNNFSSIADLALWHPQAYLILRLEEASEWTQESFFQTLKSSVVHEECISTPASLWVDNK